MTGRGLRGRRIAQAMLALALVPAPLFVLLYLAAPHFLGGPEMTGPLPFLASNMPAIGAAVYVLGLFWMVSIYRADPEGHASRFRFRR
jgi:hypothetical protein